MNNFFIKHLLFLVIVDLIHLVSSDVFTSTNHMKQLINIENDLLFNLNGYIGQQIDKLTYSENWLAEYLLINGRQTKCNEFLRIKRLLRNWNILFKILENGSKQNFSTFMNKIKDKTEFPTEEDLNGAVLGLERLQQVYKLNTSDLANGQIRSTKLKYEMSISDCNEMGTQLFKSKKYLYAAEWFNKTLQRQLKVNYNSNNFTIEVLNNLVECYVELEDYQLALDFTNKILEINPHDTNATDDKETFEEFVAANYESLTEYHRKRNAEIEANITKFVNPIEHTDPWTYDEYQRKLFETLCRNDLKESPKQLASLRCRYNSISTPFLKVAPLKFEEISLDPYIVIYHEVIYDNEIDVIKNMSISKLFRAGVQQFTENATENQHADYRISKSTIFYDNDHKYFTDISRRCSDMTGLSTKSADDFYVANYGIGGFYDSHFDFTPKNDLTFEKLGIGNRIATILFYLSDVKEGGATAFPLIKKVVFPIKGSALVWYNLHASGEGDPRTKHAGCPVLIGSKWVSNKWLHLSYQEFLRPCQLYPDDH